jgi:hypothetical protein
MGLRDFTEPSWIALWTSIFNEMESTKVVSLLEQLDDEIDDLEDSLAPVLKSALSTTLSKLPLLDKAQLYVLVTYAIESMVFCMSSTTSSLIF